MRAFVLSTVLLVTLMASSSAERVETARLIRVIEGQFILTQPDGSHLPLEHLIGVEIAIGNPDAGGVTARINTAVPDPHAGTEPLTLYDVSFRNPSTQQWEPLCRPGPQGLTLAVPVPGTWAPDGRYVPLLDGQFTFSCTSGAHLKCVRMGYTPWGTTSEGQGLAPYHQACTRMMRADYCGNGTPYTVAGHQVQVFNRMGLKTEPVYGQFEALWGVGGAVCIRRSRVPDQFPLDRILQACPRLAKAGGDACHEELMQSDINALLGNRS